MQPRYEITPKQPASKLSNKTPISNMGLFKRTPGCWLLMPPRHSYNRGPAAVLLTPSGMAVQAQPVTHLVQTEAALTLSPKKI